MYKFLRWLFATAVLGVTIILGGDRQDPWLWVFVGVFAAIAALALMSIDNDLARERFSPPEPGADRLDLRTVRLVALAHIAAGVADSRFDWTTVPPSLRAVGLGLFAAAFLLVVVAMRANRFFSAVVRIQADRGHTVVEHGPYAFVRHPGYAGMILMVPGSGLALGSWISVLLALAYSALIIRRVRFEDLFLRDRLAGYADYSRRVRYRLVPGVW